MTTVLAPLPSPAVAVSLVEQGLRWRDAVFLASKLQIPLEELARYIGVSSGTFFSRKNKRFTADESDHLMRFATIWNCAMNAFEDEVGAATWLKEGQIGLGGAVPLEYARTETGARRVETLLNRIDFGLTA